MHEIRTTATDYPVAWCLSISLFVTRLRPAKTAKRTKVSHVWGSLLGPKKHCIRRGPRFPMAGKEDSMRPSPNYITLPVTLMHTY